MKKILVWVLLALMIMGCVAAHAELWFIKPRVEVYEVGNGKDNEPITKSYYYVTISSKNGNEVELEVTRDEYEYVYKKSRKNTKYTKNTKTERTENSNTANGEVTAQPKD